MKARSREIPRQAEMDSGLREWKCGNLHTRFGTYRTQLDTGLLTLVRIATERPAAADGSQIQAGEVACDERSDSRTLPRLTKGESADSLALHLVTQNHTL